MKIWLKNYWLIVVAVLTVLVASLIYVNSLEEPDGRGLVFLTIGVDQRALENESSSYEILRAVEHFSDVVLAWTIEPSFDRELEEISGYPVSVSGRRQEKENLLFTLSARPDVFSDNLNKDFLELINSRLASYNSKTNTSYLVAINTYTPLESERNKWQFVLGMVLFALIGSSLADLLWQYGAKTSNRS